jgi:hypothetical protein
MINPSIIEQLPGHFTIRDINRGQKIIRANELKKGDRFLLFGVEHMVISKTKKEIKYRYASTTPGGRDVNVMGARSQQRVTLLIKTE